MRFPRRRLLILFVLRLLVGQSAPGKTIDGQIFIVTAGAQAIKLPLVQVRALAMTDILEHIGKIDLEIAPARVKADVAVRQLTEELERAENVVAGGFGRWMMSLRKTQPKDPTGQPWADPRTEALRYNSAKERVPKVRQRLKEAIAQQRKIHSAAAYFADLPTSIANAKTDADGRFTLTLPNGGEIAVVATSSRAVVTQVENYYWMVRLKPEDLTLILSNDNLTTSGSSDSLVTTRNQP